MFSDSCRVLPDPLDVLVIGPLAEADTMSGAVIEDDVVPTRTDELEAEDALVVAVEWDPQATRPTAIGMSSKRGS